MKLTALFLMPFVMCCFTDSAAQTNDVAVSKIRDSIINIQMEQIAIRNPTLRQIYITTDIISKGDIESKLNGNLLFKGKSNTVRTTAIFNAPIRSWGKNSLAATFTYFQQQVRVSDVQSYSTGLNNTVLNFNKGTVALTATYQRRDSIFDRPVHYLFSATGVTDDPGAIKKVSFLGTAIVPFTQTATTRISGGLILNIDPSLKIPVFPLFTYWHKLRPDLELNIGLPTGMNVRKEMSKKLWLTLGNTISGSLAFLNINSPGLPRDVNYTTIDIKNGIGAEYRLGKKIVFGVNTGILIPLSARAFDRTKTTSDYFLSNKLSNVPYINFTFSMLPFLR